MATDVSNKSEASTPDAVQIRGARVHNLKNVDVDIPRDKLIVITGPSGSGKSSLAFDTLYAEGQRQYVESLSVYARQFLHQMERPDVDSIVGLQPTISIEQRAGAPNPRSTVATVTEIYDYLRLLYSRIGSPICPSCGKPIVQISSEEIIEILFALPEGTKCVVLSPLVRGRKGAHQEAIAQIRKAGLLRVRVDGEFFELDNVPELNARKSHNIDAVVDRLVLRPGSEARAAESINLALSEAEGLVTILRPGPNSDPKLLATWQEDLYNTQYACPDCKISFAELEPRTFSFNSPYGACPICEGLGQRVEFDPELVMPQSELSIAGGLIAPWRGASAAVAAKHAKQLEPFLESQKLAVDTPYNEWSPAAQQSLWRGTGKKFAGLATIFEEEYATAMRAASIEKLEQFRGAVQCPECHGTRLRAEARACKLGGLAIYEFTALAIGPAREACAKMLEGLNEFDEQIAAPLVAEIANRLDFLEKVGVSYLTLDRRADSLSGGEAQRVRLASGIGSGLVGVCYVLDEPSIGLHPRDNARLIESLRRLQTLGNTVVVVEHDEATMLSADYLIDMGPHAGNEGGEIVAEGVPDEVLRSSESLTAQYLTKARAIKLPAERRKIAKTRSITIEEVTTNNLKNVSVQIPLGALVCVSGVSGSGKSSLINETLAPALARRLTGQGAKPGPHKSLRGASQIDRLLHIDQTAIGRTPRSNPATYVGAFDEIRKVFAGMRLSKQLGYKTGRFSFNVKGGRCEACQGQGIQKIEMGFLPDLSVKCDVCQGAKFNAQTLEVKYHGRSIADVLDQSIDEAVELFAPFPLLVRMLRSLQDVGLGYLPLGQPSTLLSGGEAQRVKLAAELGRAESGHTLYLLDEPTTGLHFVDIERLLGVLNRLVDANNTVLVIEHNLDVIKSADWVIDLGPDGGKLGGEIVALGRPEEIAESPGSLTGQFLREALSSG